MRTEQTEFRTFIMRRSREHHKVQNISTARAESTQANLFELAFWKL